MWGIGAQDSWENLATFSDQMGLTYPILFDEGGETKAQYNPGKTPTNSVYPQDWIIGVDGTVVYVNTEFEPDEMSQIIEDELEKMTSTP